MQYALRVSKVILVMVWGLISCTAFGQQQTTIQGSVKEALTLVPLSNVLITVESTNQTTRTNASGEFQFTQKIPPGEQVLKVYKSGYITKRYPIVVTAGKLLSITDMTLTQDTAAVDLFTITLSDDELNDDTSGTDNISGLLASSLDVFQRTAAFEFSSSFFRLRGLDSNNGTVMINGVEMNKFYNGRPQWSNWGGLNDVMRNQELSTGLELSGNTFGGLLGSSNIDVRASHARAGGRITYSSSNRSYTNRLMATYASGRLQNNWAYTISLGRRWGQEGYQDGTSYNANSFFVAAEKIFSNTHSLNLTAIYTPNRRGKSSPNTQEVYDLKDIQYNAYWGWQDGKKRNARIKEVSEPIVMINHYWNISNQVTLNTNVAYQFGKMGNSRIDYNGKDLVDGFPQGGGANPSPTYYQKLPSYFERNNPDDLGLAYQALKTFETQPQIDWEALYSANINHAKNGGNALYAQYEDRVDDTKLTFNTLLEADVSEHILVSAGLTYSHLKSSNYAKVLDLLGGSSYLDVDGFASTIDEAQNDLLHPNKQVRVGDTFKYNYNILATRMNAFAQAQFNYNKTDFFISTQIEPIAYQREGIYQNGGFPKNSLGKGKTQRFLGYGIKSGLRYKFTGRHIVSVNGGYIVQAPTIQNTYTNARENQNTVPDITEETITAFDASYFFRSPFLRAKLTGYYTKIANANAIAFFFADGIGGDHAIFVQEILRDINKKHIGFELGLESQITPTIKLKGAAALGQFTYDNNPKLALTTEADADATAAGFVKGFKDFGETTLKNYRIASGPQTAYSAGFEYRDPDFWWFGATTNFFDNTYINVSPLKRSSNFNTDFDGNVFNDYNPDLAQKLLKQERFKDYMVVNLVGGKSWKVGDYYIGLFASVNNLFNKRYKTGGFEQGRSANYRQLEADQALATPVFGSKYWYGRGTTYFLNLNLRF